MKLPQGYRLSQDREAMQIEVIHGFLARSYWSPGIPRSIVKRAIAGSHCIGAFHGTAQVGFGRVITDHATFAYLADVFVLEAHRGRGLARAMVGALQAEESLQGLRRWLLKTRDAHPLYESLGWSRIDDPESLMQRHKPDSYR